MECTQKSFMELIEPMDLYNLLNVAFHYSCVSDPNYLLLIDARKLHEYNESHIFTAKKASKIRTIMLNENTEPVIHLFSWNLLFSIRYLVRLPPVKSFQSHPLLYVFSPGKSNDCHTVDSNEEFTVVHDAELECKTYIVVYDGTSESLDDLDTPAMRCGRLLADKGSRNPVRILCGGYERFSALYPFLRTQKIMWLPQELDDIKTYPIEIIPAALYLGNNRQGNAEYITKDLKIRGKICCSTENISDVTEDEHNMAIPIQDDNNMHREKQLPVLVYSDLGYSRAAALCIAYLMHTNQTKPTMQESYELVRRCNINACPNTALLTQLQNWQ